MTELEIKKVDFYDSELIGVQETATGKVFTAINNVLRLSLIHIFRVTDYG